MTNEILIKTLCGLTCYNGPGQLWPRSEIGRRIAAALLPNGVELYRRVDAYTALQPGHWRHNAFTLQSYAAMHRIVGLYHMVSALNVPGELVECGVWRGGVGMLLAHISEGHGRIVRLCDSYAGLPPAGDQDEGHLDKVRYLSVPLDRVITHFQLLEIPLRHVRFEEGLFAESLPRLIGREYGFQIALLHIDCDLYSSTMDVLDNLYPKVSPGGVIIMDDWFDDSQAGRAVMAYFNKNGPPLPVFKPIDSNSCYWIKPTE